MSRYVQPEMVMKVWTHFSTSLDSIKPYLGTFVMELYRLSQKVLKNASEMPNMFDCYFMLYYYNPT